MTLTALIVDVPGSEAENLSDALLAAGALSVTSEELHRAGRKTALMELSEPGAWSFVRLTALCGGEQEPAQVLSRACAASGVAVRAHQLSRVPDEDWVAKSRSDFGPIRVSQRLWVVPSWCTPPEADAVNLLLDPGLAFGTGSHASTRLCLRWLERRIAGGETVLDYGCGSGILAIASLMLGASRAVGIDIDPDAVAAARANALRNGVAGEFLESGSPLDFTVDLVVANILANPLKILAPILAERCRRGGHIALSGILAEQASDVEQCYASWISFAPRDEEDGWVCLSGVKQ
ncbi:MAG TPA: 50S ribosomal protein L11 methyltransferase [Burkholderiales bacterium]|nr:50S ribosomal protein L11 methyltransferase [Burkholderiales bacterium]